MTVNDTVSTSRRVRCGVCKIDRKGRIVYVDSEGENLFGGTQVELFGRPLTDFLVAEDQPLLDEITSQFNHYETFYDSARVTLIDSHGKRRRASLVISLNFDAGNPVNFQVIINPRPEPQTDQNQPSEIEIADSLFTRIFKQPPSEANLDLAQEINKYIRADAVQFFRTDQGPWQLLAQTPEGVFVDPNITPTAEAEIALSDDFHLVMRTAYAHEIPASEKERIDNRTHLVAQMLSRLMISPMPEMQGSTAFSLASTHSVVDLLGFMQVGAALIGSDGSIEDANQPFDEFVGHKTSSQDLTHIAESLSSPRHSEIETVVLNYLETSTQFEAPPHMQLTIRGHNGARAAFSLVRLAPGSEDLSGFAIIWNLSGQSETQATPTGTFLRDILARMASSIAAAISVGQQVQHEHHGDLSDDGKFYLQCLHNHLAKLNASVSTLAALNELSRTDVDRQMTDMNLLFDQVLEDIAAETSQGSLTLKRNELPKAILHRAGANRIIRAVVRHLARQTAGRGTEIQVTSSLDDRYCTLVFADPGATNAEEVSRWLSCRPELSDPLGGLAVASELARSAGGDLTIVPREAGGLTYTVRLAL